MKMLLFLLMPFILAAQAPDIAWQKRLGATSYDLGTAMCHTADGGYLVAGSSNSNAGFEKSQNSIGGSDYWVLKLDQSGTVEWDKTIGGAQVNGMISNENDNLSSVIQTSDGGYILAGYSDSEASGNKTENCRGQYDYWIVKLSSNGTIIWQRTLGGALMDGAATIINTIDGGSLVAGSSQSDISGDKTEYCRGVFDVWLIKLTASGIIEWQKTIGGSGYDDINSKCIIQNSNGEIIVAAVSDSDISGEKTENSRGLRDIWLMRLSSDGELLNQKTIGGSDDDIPTYLIPTSDGNYFLSIQSKSPVSGEKTGFCRGGFDNWFVKFDTSFSIIWQQTIGGNNYELPTCLYQCSDNGFITSGDSRSGISGEKTTPVLGYSDAWVLKLNETGEIEWQKTIGGYAPGTYGGQDAFRDVNQLSDESFIFFGLTDSNISGDIVDFPRGSFDYWLVKLEAESLSVNDVADRTFVVYPNPVENEINIKFKTVEASIEATLYNSLAQQILDKRFMNTDLINIAVDIPCGVYLLKIKSGTHFSTVKILKP